MAGLNNLFGLHFHNGLFLLKQYPKCFRFTRLKLSAPTPMILEGTASPLCYS